MRPKWEEHHKVRIADNALEAAVNLSVRFDPDHQLPDKAIDLVDKAGARTRVPVLSMMPGRKDGRRGTEDGRGIAAGAEETGGEVTELTVAQVLSDKIGVPLEVVTGHLEGMAQSRLLELNSFLKRRLIGQDEAVERVCRRLLMAHAGLAQRRGPLGVFLFLGPTGVGKTQLAKLMAEFLFGSESDMIRLDMSEYMEEHSAAKLIGSPPGYVGHEEEGQLTGRLRTRPYSVVLLDEVEKAHPRVFDLFLQVFDEGRVTDAKGRTADARNAIFVMTSNIQAGKQFNVGFQDKAESRTAMQHEVKARFRAEFINRVDEQIVFRPLSEEDARRILRPMLDAISEELRKRHRLFRALQARQQQDGCANNVVAFVARVMNPARFQRKPECYAEFRNLANVSLAFAGYQVSERGEVVIVPKAGTLIEAESRASNLQAELRRRNVHPDVLRFCRAELLQQNYFHAVLEATKSLSDKIREKTGLTCDAGELAQKAFSCGQTGVPFLALNSLRTESERSEQSGFMNLFVGAFGAFRNPTAHSPKILWEMKEQEALDCLTLVSLLHRLLDDAVRTPRQS
jgi:uncharacterized protein (TIGR02391 family)